MDPEKFRNIPVSTTLGVMLVIVFSLYLTTAIKTIPCGKDVMSIFLSNFVHTDFTHLMVNLLALYALSRVEKTMGMGPFLGLLVYLLVFNTVTESILHRIIPTLRCSIGFSGILFGIMTWELISTRELDLYIVGSIVAMVCLPSITKKSVSLIGHGVGAVIGVVGALIWKRVSLSLLSHKSL
jgi:membrane associated rhomboid family serine protease